MSRNRCFVYQQCNLRALIHVLNMSDLLISAADQSMVNDSRTTASSQQILQQQVQAGHHRRNMVVTRDRIDWQNAQNIGNGIFGNVLVTRACGVRPDEDISWVLLKELTNKDENVHALMKDENELYTKTEHLNVFKFLTLIRDCEPVTAVYEYSPCGNLKSYLLLSRGHGEYDEYPAPLNAKQILSVAYQVAQGMEHISDNRFVHKDLAARNVLLYPGLHAKIGSLSLQNDAFLNEYYMYRNLVLPLRWMPAEALLDDDFSMKSDVWSFGVFFWELYAQGELPYQTYSNAQLIEALKADRLDRLNAPAHVPDMVLQLMDDCWSTDPRERPTFTHIRDIVGQLNYEL